eukprot:4659258-Amphidinium_carterae.2
MVEKGASGSTQPECKLGVDGVTPTATSSMKVQTALRLLTRSSVGGQERGQEVTTPREHPAYRSQL